MGTLLLISPAAHRVAGASWPPRRWNSLVNCVLLAFLRSACPWTLCILQARPEKHSPPQRPQLISQQHFLCFPGMASLKFYLNQHGKQQVRRARIASLETFNFSALVALASEVFPSIPASAMEFGYFDDEDDLVNISSDRDVEECCQHMDLASKKTLRIDIAVMDEERKAEGHSSNSSAHSGPPPDGGLPAVLNGVHEKNPSCLCSPLSTKWRCPHLLPSAACLWVRFRDADPSSYTDFMEIGAPKAPSTSRCAFCGTNVDSGIRFCSAECSDREADFSATISSTPVAASRRNNGRSLLLHGGVNGVDGEAFVKSADCGEPSTSVSYHNSRAGDTRHAHTSVSDDYNTLSHRFEPAKCVFSDQEAEPDFVGLLGLSSGHLHASTGRPLVGGQTMDPAAAASAAASRRHTLHSHQRGLPSDGGHAFDAYMSGMPAVSQGLPRGGGLSTAATTGPGVMPYSTMPPSGPLCPPPGMPSMALSGGAGMYTPHGSVVQPLVRHGSGHSDRGQSYGPSLLPPPGMMQSSTASAASRRFSSVSSVTGRSGSMASASSSAGHRGTLGSYGDGDADTGSSEHRSSAASGSNGEAVVHEPSVCIPWVSPDVSRDLVVSTFEQFGTILQVDLVPRDDHFLCFVHFSQWRTEDPQINVVRVSTHDFVWSTRVAAVFPLEVSSRLPLLVGMRACARASMCCYVVAVKRGRGLRAAAVGVSGTAEYRVYRIGL